MRSTAKNDTVQIEIFSLVSPLTFYCFIEVLGMGLLNTPVKLRYLYEPNQKDYSDSFQLFLVSLPD